MERTLIVGLGNPGSKYAQTRHNVGFLALELLAADLGVTLTQEKLSGHFTQGSLPSGHPVTLLAPQTFMNLSGKSVAPCVKFFQVPLERVIVIHDELEFPYGLVRVKVGGGHAGHNGLRSIIEQLGGGPAAQSFVRLRVGIGRPPRGSVSDYVLSPFSAEEAPWLDDVCRQVARDVAQVITEGARAAMNTIHARPSIFPRPEAPPTSTPSQPT